MTGFRLADGGRIDRTRALSFRFDGRQYQGFAGDTLASALLAAGVQVVGRSLKFHRPRGIFSAGAEEPNAWVSLGEGGAVEPSVCASTVALREGLVAHSQKGWPSVEFDVGRLFDLLSPLLPAGFYHKTFKWPRWGVYEPAIRAMAGLGRVPMQPDTDRYDHVNAQCDVLIIGGGAAGLAAALAAGASGARTMLVEQDQEFGGYLLWARALLDDGPASDWARQAVDTLHRQSVRLLAQTTATGYYDHNVVTLLEQNGHGSTQPRQRYWTVRAGEVILATGAIEQPLIFCNNDRPGILLAGAVRHYLNRFGAAAGHRAVIATNNDSGYRTALDLADAGITVACVVDSRTELHGALPRMAVRRGICIREGCWIADTHGRTLKAVDIASDPATASANQFAGSEDCDVLAMSGGWAPMLHLYSQARGKLRYESGCSAFVPDRSGPSLCVVGAAAGTFSLCAAIGEALAAGQRAASRCGLRPANGPVCPTITEPHLLPMQQLRRHTPLGATRKQWIDYLHDATVSDIELAVREGYVSVEHMKRNTTIGMALDQGKTSSLNAIEVLAELTGRAPGEVGVTTFRPPFVPVRFGAIAGRSVGKRFSPERRMPAHDWHARHAAVFEDFGGWRRPAYYVRAGESRETSIAQEVLSVRQSVGLFESSPLGKIDVRGADAAQFLNRLYINNLLTLAVGRVRYGLMLNENGIIIDDGTVARLAEDHFLITTTTGNGARIAAWLEEWRQCEWRDLEVLTCPVTSQWASITVTGPEARRVLQALETDVDLSREAFPHLSIRCGRLEGVPTRIYRVSFSGELGYEINVPASYGQALWERLIEVGTPLHVAPYGVEALLILRLEKGFIHVGSDTDGTTIPSDIGFGGIVGKKREDFIGRRSLLLPNHVRNDRLQLVGLSDASDVRVLVAGAHLRLEGQTQGTAGWITSAALSPTLNRPIALAMLSAGRQRLGERVCVHDEDRVARATVVDSLFYDPTGERMNA